MKKVCLLLLIFMIVISCKKQSDLSKNFNCNSKNLSHLKVYTDFKNNFKLHIPNTWKTTKYYSEIQSEIFTADTVKQLTETYILNAAFAFGNVNFDTAFYQKIDSLASFNNFKIVKTGTITFQNSPSYFNLLKGQKNGFTYHQFNIISKKTINTYFSSSVEIYGELNVEERLCESIGILEKIEFLQ